jgi:hypothetical protein
MWLKLVFPATLLVIGHLALTTKRFLVTEAGKLKSDEESAETNRMMGLALQGQGQLDMAFDRFRRVPMSDAVMDNLYNLALDFERKRQFNKAQAVYEHMATYEQGLQGPAVQAQPRQEPVRNRHAGRRRSRTRRHHAARRRRGRKADAGPLPGRKGAGQGRHGRGLPGQGPEDRARGGHQDHGPEPGVRGRGAGPMPASASSARPRRPAACSTRTS